MCIQIEFAGPSAQGRVRSRARPCLLPSFIPPVDPGPLPPSRLVPPGKVSGSLFTLGPLLGPQNELHHYPWVSLGVTLAPEHAPRTPSGPSKNRSERKMELLKKNTRDLPQNLSPGTLLLIQAPPKTAHMDRHTCPEGAL